jgi:tRNA-dihydrouridine synthase B
MRPVRSGVSIAYVTRKTDGYNLEDNACALSAPFRNNAAVKISAHAASRPTFWVRGLPVCGSAVLAPMDGYSDWPFRSLCRSLGSAMSYTEFVKVEHILRSPRHAASKLYFEQPERPVVFQIYGDDPDEIVRAALVVQDMGPDIIDINMGCPARSVAHRGAGVGLMRTPVKVGRLFRRLSAALRVPVTAKIRLGWEHSRTYKLIARIVEENGGSLIAVHGRTKEQRYGGCADWDAIAEVKSVVSIPVIGNGDVRTVADIERLQKHTGCEAVMIGRAAIANPWIFSELDRNQVTDEQVRCMVASHLERNVRFYGAEDGQRLFRKHAVQYLFLQRLSREDRKDILRQRPSAEFIELLNNIYAPAWSASLLTGSMD